MDITNLPGHVVQMSGYKGDNKMRTVHVEIQQGNLVTGTVEQYDHAYRSYLLEHANGLTIIRK